MQYLTESGSIGEMPQASFVQIIPEPAASSCLKPSSARFAPALKGLERLRHWLAANEVVTRRNSVFAFDPYRSGGFFNAL